MTTSDNLLFPPWDKCLWVDVETTGLDPNMDVLLEVGAVVTDMNLEVLDSKSWVIRREPKGLPNLEQVVFDMHSKSGLWSECFYGQSQSLMTMSMELDSFIRLHFENCHSYPQADRPPLHGSSVHFDHQFLTRAWTHIDDLVSYRHVDTSTLKNIMDQRMHDVFERRPKGRKLHRVLPDIEDSIEEYKYYLTALGLMSNMRPVPNFIEDN